MSRPWPDVPPLPHAQGDRLHALLLARLARHHGQSASPGTLQAEAARQGLPVSAPAFASAWFNARGFRVLRSAGSVEVARDLARRGVPFLLYRLVREGASYREAPVLVRDFDARARLWIVDEPNVLRPDLLPEALPVKARLLAVVPRRDPDVFAAHRGRSASQLGALLETVVDLRVRGRGDEAMEVLLQADGTLVASAVHALYESWLRYREALATPARLAWEATIEPAGRAAAVSPLLAFELFLEAQARAAEGKPAESIAALERLVRLEGPSASVSLARSGGLRALGRDDEANRVLTMAAQHDPLDLRVLYFRATSRDTSPEQAEADLLRAFERDPRDVRVAVALAQQLAKAQRREEALRVLAKATRHAESDPVRKQIANARERVELLVIERADTPEQLDAIGRSENPDTRRRLAMSLATSTDSDASELRLRGMLKDRDPAVRVTVLRLYIRSWLRKRLEGDGLLGRRVVALMQRDPDPAVRSAAAATLGYVRRPFAERALLGLMRGREADPHSAVRASAARALGSRDTDPARTGLVAALADAHRDVRAAALEVLFQLAATRHGFDPDGAAPNRAAALRRWRAWLAQRAAEHEPDSAPR